jgi:hypothetical protein
MTSRLRNRIAALELAVRPSGRDFFVPLDNDPFGPTYDEQIAAFKIDHGVRPHDKVRRIFRIAEGDNRSDLPFKERIAAFEAEHNVGPHDTLIVVRFVQD